jgi:hypothetical protein
MGFEVQRQDNSDRVIAERTRRELDSMKASLFGEAVGLENGANPHRKRKGSELTVDTRAVG